MDRVVLELMTLSGVLSFPLSVLFRSDFEPYDHTIYQRDHLILQSSSSRHVLYLLLCVDRLGGPSSSIVLGFDTSTPLRNDISRTVRLQLDYYVSWVSPSFTSSWI